MLSHMLVHHTDDFLRLGTIRSIFIDAILNIDVFHASICFLNGTAWECDQIVLIDLLVGE